MGREARFRESRISLQAETLGFSHLLKGIKPEFHQSMEVARWRQPNLLRFIRQRQFAILPIRVRRVSPTIAVMRSDALRR